MLRVIIMLLIQQLYNCIDSDKVQKDSTYNSTYITKDG